MICYAIALGDENSCFCLVFVAQVLDIQTNISVFMGFLLSWGCPLSTWVSTCCIFQYYNVIQLKWMKWIDIE